MGGRNFREGGESLSCRANIVHSAHMPCLARQSKERLH